MRFPQWSRAKRLRALVIFTLVLFALVFLWWGFRQYMIARFMANYHPPAPYVETAKAKTVNWQRSISAIGDIHAHQGVEIAPEVSGVVNKIHFTSGAQVQKGAPLFDLDTQVEEANLHQHESSLALAKLDYRRYKDLSKTKSVALSQLDLSAAKLKEAEAALQGIKAQIAHKHLQAPFSGRLGVRRVDVGAYVAPGTSLVSLQDINTVFVDFFLPQQYLNKIKTGLLVRVESGKHHWHGKLIATDSRLDNQTRNLWLRARVANHSHALLPGMFVRVKLLLEEHDPVVIVPVTAMSYSLYGNSIYRVTSNKKGARKVQRVFVKTGEQRGNWIEVTTGIHSGDEVVTSGQLKLHPDMPVQINNKQRLFS